MSGPQMSGPTMGGAPRPNSAVGAVAIPETLALPTSAAARTPTKSYPRFRVSVREYVTFRDQGFLIVKGLVPTDDVAELGQHVEDLIHGCINVPGLEPPPP